MKGDILKPGDLLSPSYSFVYSANLPVNRDANLIARLVFEKQIPVLFSIEKKISGNGHILLAVVNDFTNAPLLPPAQSLETVRGFLGIQCFLGKVLQGKPVA